MPWRYAMNFKTTLVLLVLAAAAGLLLVFNPPLPPFRPPQATTVRDAGIPEELLHPKPDSLTRIEVHKGDRVVLLERKGGEWSMPGNWPSRQAEVRELVELLGNLHSRFEPDPVAGDENLKARGLLPP